MSDDRSNRGEPDRSRISLDQDYVVSYWTQILGAGKKELTDATRAVGNSPEQVRAYLQKQSASAGR